MHTHPSREPRHLSLWAWISAKLLWLSCRPLKMESKPRAQGTPGAAAGLSREARWQFRLRPYSADQRGPGLCFKSCGFQLLLPTTQWKEMAFQRSCQGDKLKSLEQQNLWGFQWTMLSLRAGFSGPTYSLTPQPHRGTRERSIQTQETKEFLTEAKRRHRKNCEHSSGPPEEGSSVHLDDPERQWWKK